MFCSVDGCNRVIRCKGYCGKHYEQYRIHGKTFNVTCMDFNEVVDCGDHYELILLDRKMNEKGRAKIDKEDLKKVKKVGRWCLNSDGYVVHIGSTGNHTYMHRLIMNAKPEDVDHVKTGIKFKSDNRKKNLRFCTDSQNKYNRERPKNNKSGHKGICWHKACNKWLVQISINKKRIYLGSFTSLDDAINAYETAAKKYHKQFLHESVGLKKNKRNSNGN